MTRSAIRNIACHACGYEQKFGIYQSVNVTLDLALKQRILDGTLMQFICEACGQEARFSYPMIYHDMTRRLWIWLDADGEADQPGPPELGPLLANLGREGYMLRVVGSLFELVEKIRLNDAGLDDRLMELFKAVLWDNLEDDARAQARQLLYDSLDSQAAHGPQIAFALMGPEGAIAGVTVSRETAYQPLVVRLQELLPPARAERGRLLRVDRDYARRLFERQ